MFSWEIDKLLRKSNFCISRDEYREITNVRINTQIVRIKYNPYSDNFLMETNDGYGWKFRIMWQHKKGKKKENK